MILHCFHLEGLSVNTYFVGDETTGRAVIIDPTRDLEPYVRFAQLKKFQITDILETHVHADFVSGSRELKQRLLNRPKIHCSALGGEEWIPDYADYPFKDGHIVELGNVRLQALHTPGHTPEHVIWLCYDEARSKEIPCLVFTGDLLFVGGIGRPDLLGKDAEKTLALSLYNSLFNVMGNLPDFLEIFPAHGAGSLCGKGLSARPSSTLGYERMFNPSMIKEPADIWTQKLLKDISAAPLNFSRLKKMNVHPIQKLEKSAHFMIDVRNPQNFAKGHLKGAVNIPFGNPFCNWAGSIVPDGASITIIGEDGDQLAEVKTNLGLIGFDTIEKMMVWSEREEEIDTLSLISVEAVAEQIKEGIPLYILDVRMPAEWKSGHIKEAHLLELSTLADKLNQIPRTMPILTICGSGYRSSLAASYLKKHGYKDVSSIWGGMSAWKKANLPVIP